MQYGIIVTSGDPRAVARRAAEAEAAGWDGVFYFDGVSIAGLESFDPWVVMSAMATATDRVRLGAIITPPTRRRPWKLAHEAMSLDHLSGGRLVLPVGLGALDDLAFGNVGEATDTRTRAERLDESLAILDGLWAGEPFAFHGHHYQFGPMTIRPRPVQRPRIPIWVVGVWPRERSIRRALAWDGIVIQAQAASGAPTALTPGVVREVVEHAGRERAAAGHDGPWEVIAQGTTSPADPAAAAATVDAFAAAGATWWIEADWEGGEKVLRRRIAAGPPAAGARQGA